MLKKNETSNQSTNGIIFIKNNVNDELEDKIDDPIKLDPYATSN